MERNKIYKSKDITLKLRKIVYYILGIFEAIFAFRLVFKLLGANPGSAFVSIIYDSSEVFMTPFNGIFKSAVNKGLETKSVLEPTTIIAMIVYALIAYGVVKLIKILGNHDESDYISR